MLRTTYFLLLLFFTPYFSFTQTPQKYAVVVGVANYEGSGYDLNYCDDDAYRFSSFLKSDKGGIKKENMAVLIDEAANKANIINTMHKIYSKASPNDMIVFFFSGHGGENNVFYPYDISRNVLAFDEIKSVFKRYKVKNKIVYADACFAGNIGNNSSNRVNTSVSTSFNQQDTNILIFMSSTGQEVSQEIASVRQGAFSYFLINGLEGKADRNKDNYVTVEELYPYVKANVLKATNNKQTPTIKGKSPRKLVLSSLNES
ncbi:caspase family protein [Flammeovirga sp. SubArs3]|uniref:caspase family protein n=1 Tax=Flammeovirga sp. SubArs3 TaxID=2995316 RepID=UPI00248B42CD|nr:caspase family protein [Flammeovirga sp. SubArs3]